MAALARARGSADVLGAVNHLPLQVGEIDDIEIDQADAAHSRRCQIHAERRAQAAGADQQHFGLLQFELPFHAYFGHDQVAAVAQDFFLGKRFRLGRRRFDGRAASDAGNDGDDVAIFNRRGIAIQIADIFVV